MGGRESSHQLAKSERKLEAEECNSGENGRSVRRLLCHDGNHPATQDRRSSSCPFSLAPPSIPAKLTIASCYHKSSYVAWHMHKKKPHTIIVKRIAINVKIAIA
jgi:hypothetical protein